MRSHAKQAGRDKPVALRKLQRAALLSGCGAHIIQDGLTALKYVLLPIIAQNLGLSYSQVGLLRGTASAAMSLLEVPAGILAERHGERRLLVLGLFGAAAGYVVVAFSPALAAIALGFFVAGAGAAFQHSLSSSLLVARFSDGERRRALGTYNASGDAGKLLFTGLFSLGVGAGVAWNVVVIALAGSAIALALLIAFVLKPADTMGGAPAGSGQSSSAKIGNITGWGILNARRFSVLSLVIYLDSVIQATLLTFLAFVLMDKGVAPAMAAAGVTIALAGGMAGKYACGYLAANLGDRRAFILMQSATALGLGLLVILPAMQALISLPLLGLVVQGSSTITYGAVADHLHAQRQSRGYSVIYTLAGIASVTGPIIFGMLADQYDVKQALSVLVVLALITMPLSFVLNGSARNTRPVAAR